MESIIQQIALELAKNILEKGLSEKIHDIDALSSEVLVDCKKAATDVIRVILEHLNEQIRRDKSRRKEAGLIRWHLRNTDLDQRIGAKKKYIELIHEVDVNKKTNNNLTRPACRCHLTVRTFT